MEGRRKGNLNTSTNSKGEILSSFYISFKIIIIKLLMGLLY